MFDPANDALEEKRRIAALLHDRMAALCAAGEAAGERSAAEQE